MCNIIKLIDAYDKEIKAVMDLAYEDLGSQRSG